MKYTQNNQDKNYNSPISCVFTNQSVSSEDDDINALATISLHEAIFQRVSRRQYLSVAIEPEKVDILRSIIGKYNRESGLSMQFIEDGGDAFNGLNKSYGMFGGVRSIIVLKGDKEDVDLEEKSGYYGERIVLEATRMQLGTCWVGASFDKKSPVFDMTGNEKRICVIPVGNVPPEKTAKERFIRRMSHGKTKPPEHFYTADAAPPAWFTDGIKAVQVAPSAVNRQKYKFSYKNGEVKVFTQDTSQFAMVDLGIAKAHFEIVAGGKFGWGDGALFKKW